MAKQMSLSISLPSWIPETVNEWFNVPDEKGSTWVKALIRTMWSTRIKSVILYAEQEIDKLKRDFHKRETKYRMQAEHDKEIISAYKSTIKSQDKRISNDHEKYSRSLESLKRKNVTLKTDIESMTAKMKDLKRINIDLESKQEKHYAGFLPAFLKIANSEQDEREELKKKILILKDQLEKQKEKTAKAVSDLKDQKHKNDLVSLNFATLEAAHKKMEKVRDTMSKQKEDLEKRNNLLEEDKNNALQDCEDAKKELEDEKKRSEHLRNTILALGEQLNIPPEYLF